MAQSPSHRFGQIIGEVLEAALRKPLEEVCVEHGLYLDWKHPRPARNGLSKVAWRDRRGNMHDLDYVIEQGGSEETIGVPKAFIEIAWRRYTKHSRNKAQEIQGAIIPLAETWQDAHPFLGAVLAGVFTKGSLNQLRSHGFQLLYVPYDIATAAFASVGIDASFDEDTPDEDLAQKVALFGQLTARKKLKLIEDLRQRQAHEIGEFLSSLKKSLSRVVVAVFVLPLFGAPHELPDAIAAIAFLDALSTPDRQLPVVRYEIMVRFSNGDEIRGSYEEKQLAVQFLRSVQ